MQTRIESSEMCKKKGQKMERKTIRGEGETRAAKL